MDFVFEKKKKQIKIKIQLILLIFTFNLIKLLAKVFITLKNIFVYKFFPIHLISQSYSSRNSVP